MALFELYWNFLGLPLSRLKGAVVDRLPFSVVEGALWVGLCLTALAVTSELLRFSRRGRLVGGLRWAWLGPAGLVILGLGQGAFPLSLSPSAWREPVSRHVPHDTLSEIGQDARLHAHWSHLWAEITPERYFSLSEPEVVVTCSRLLDSVLARLRMTPGREVRAIKPMGPLTTALGLVYGGPAFHDPLFGELALVRAEDMPSSHFWRMHAACHETAHAKGFTREMDAELLTQAALSLSDDERYRLLGDLLYLAKSGQGWHFPAMIREDMRAARARRKEVEARQTVVMRLRQWAERLNLRNSPKKYGDRSPQEAWNPRHPFYATLTGILTPDARPILTYPVSPTAPLASGMLP